MIHLENLPMQFILKNHQLFANTRLLFLQGIFASDKYKLSEEWMSSMIDV